MAPKAPLVSVVLPVKNGGQFLDSAVDSILQQSLEDFELLLVDDHSSDDSISRLDKNDSRLKILPSQGQGIVSALNTGLAAAKGHFIARMDADDYSLPHRFRTQLDFLAEQPSIHIVGAQVEMFAENTLAGGYRRYQCWINSLRSPEDIRRELFIESPLPHPSWFMHRKVIDQLGHYRDMPWPEDYDFLLRADAAGMFMAKPDSVLLRWRDHEQRLSRCDDRYAVHQFQAAKASFLASHRIGGRRVAIWGAGPTGRVMHDLLDQLGVAISGFIEVHPRRVGGSKRGLPVFDYRTGLPDKNHLLLIAVGVAKARNEIREHLQERGWCEGENYLFVA